ncbi:YjzD family protein [Vagococcus carniphilus]|uniref:YjzD family protein n=1 Tax=Vagococcus carniphilus TaxID=218144 RepID=A0AAW8U2G7_9ENTE|nr:YjzD family protein [Vagococcus carniphilus]MDT2816138.1 YjzD family protein [Vagococcus carniphilus]MDT2829580.1 YjzD family protein [Vagococcus carniphilus]MDT2833718.1 YjzD family protein [Vagococcus carniphilus]MDT2839039.1 YjzD family protein [Vagococcus carniphilus]MDT2847671.1 YjzD family protein [Vagococcus carniphilus]
MKNLIVLLWSLILGQVVGYIGGALTGGTYDFVQVTTISLICGVIIMLLGEAALPKKQKKSAAK